MVFDQLLKGVKKTKGLGEKKIALEPTGSEIFSSKGEIAKNGSGMAEVGEQPRQPK
jgi:hypothetical protein